MPPTMTLSRRAAGSLLCVLPMLPTADCAGRPVSMPSTLRPATAARIDARSPYAKTPVDHRAKQLRAVSRVVRHWFGRYRVRYSDVVRIETLVAHVDSPTRADVFVVATFTNAGSVDSHGRPILDRPTPGRYYRSVQLQLRDGRWQIESVRPA